MTAHPIERSSASVFSKRRGLDLLLRKHVVMTPRRTTMNYTRCSNTSNITETTEEYLQQLEDKTNIAVIPAVIMLCIFSVVGVPGNILVLIVYSRKQGINSTKVLITAIASFDLVANVAAIPMAINMILHTWHFQTAVVCKVTTFVGSFSVLGGAISLLVVAFTRYRMVCKPFEWQVTSRQAIISSLVTFLLAIVFSTPYFIIYGVKTRQTPCPYIQGSECFVDDKYINTIWPLLNNVFFVALYLFLSINLVVLYVLVGKVARMHRVCGEVLSLKSSVASVAKMESAPRGMSKVLVCCIRHPEKQKSLDDTLDDTQSSVVQNEIKTTSGENDQANLQTYIDLDATAGQAPGLVFNDTADEYAHLRSHSKSTVTNLPADKNTPTVSSKVNTPIVSSKVNTPTVSSKVNTPIVASKVNTPIVSSKVNTPTLHADHRLTPKVPVGIMFSHNREIILNNDTVLNGHLVGNAPHTMKRHNGSINAIEVHRHDLSFKYNDLSTAHTLEPIHHIQTQKERGTLSRTTTMLIIISSIYVLGFLPFLILTTLKSKLPEMYSNMNMIEHSFYNLLYRLYFLNSAVNPIVYSLCNSKFRHDCISVVTGRRGSGFSLS